MTFLALLFVTLAVGLQRMVVVRLTYEPNPVIRVQADCQCYRSGPARSDCFILKYRGLYRLISLLLLVIS